MIPLQRQHIHKIQRAVFYTFFFLFVTAYTLWARQQEGLIHVSGLILLCSVLAGGVWGEFNRSEVCGWLLGLRLFFIMSLLFLLLLPALKRFAL